MPGFDGSGPAGGGPMTGGARGYCNFGPPMGSIDQGQGVVSALVMAEAEGVSAYVDERKYFNKIKITIIESPPGNVGAGCALGI